MQTEDFIRSPEGEGTRWILFEDGELCLTKCGELLGQRNLHLIKGGTGRRTDRPECIYQSPFGAGWRCCYPESEEEADRIRKSWGVQ